MPDCNVCGRPATISRRFVGASEPIPTAVTQSVCVDVLPDAVMVYKHNQPFVGGGEPTDE